MTGITPKEYTDAMIAQVDKRTDQRFADLEKAMLLAIKIAKDEGIAKTKTQNTMLSFVLGIGSFFVAAWALVRPR